MSAPAPVMILSLPPAVRTVKFSVAVKPTEFRAPSPMLPVKPPARIHR